MFEGGVSGVKRAYGGSKSKGLRPFASRETRIVRPSMGLPLCAARSGASAARCPKLLQANLSLRRHGCRSEHRRSRWPEGRGTGRAESTLGSSPGSLPAIRKKPALRAGLVLRKWAGLFASLTLPAKYKGPPFGRAFVFGWETRIRT